MKSDLIRHASGLQLPISGRGSAPQIREVDDLVGPGWCERLGPERGFLCRGTRQAGLARRSPIDDRRAGAIGQYVAGDLVLSGEPDIPLVLGIGQEAVERAYPARMA